VTFFSESRCSCTCV